MVFVERLHTRLHHLIKFVPHTRGTSPYTLLVASGGRERNAAHPIVKQFLQQVSPTHLAITDGEEEPVAHHLCGIVIIDDVETVVRENLLHLFGTTGILAGIFHEIDFPFGGETEHLGIRILGGCRTSRSNHIEDRRDECLTEHACILVSLGQCREMTFEELVADASQRHSLAGIAEYLRGREHQDIVVGIMRHGRRIRRLERMSHIATEIHTEVSQVLHHDDIVLGGQFANNRQLFFFQANPRRVVRIGIDDSSYIALCQERFELFTKGGSPMLINVEFLPLGTDNAELGLLDRETRVDEEHLVLARCALRTGDERAIRARHTSHGRHTRAGTDIDIEECLHETGCLVLQLGYTGSCRILRAYASIECRLLGLHPCLIHGQAGRALIHTDERNTRLLLQILCHQQHFADGRSRKVGHSTFPCRLFH